MCRCVSNGRGNPSRGLHLNELPSAGSLIERYAAESLARNSSNTEHAMDRGCARGGAEPEQADVARRDGYPDPSFQPLTALTKNR
jgi:hypothetical protein